MLLYTGGIAEFSCRLKKIAKGAYRAHRKEACYWTRVYSNTYDKGDDPTSENISGCCRSGKGLAAGNCMPPSQPRQSGLERVLWDPAF